MIASENEYRVTLQAVRDLAVALLEADHDSREVDVRHRQLIQDGIESQLHDLRAEVAEYESRVFANPPRGAD